MDWLKAIQNAIDYIENHLTEELDYDEIARNGFSSSYHFQRVFGILCGYTLGEYIRFRRLTLAARELNQTDIKVIDAAVKYGYDSPDSFTKAFSKFHGITPSEAKKNGAKLNSFSRLTIKITLEGGNTMNYEIKTKPEMKFLGLKRHFEGSPADRYEQAHDFAVEGETRFICHALKSMAEDCETIYHIINNVSDYGYDFAFAATVGDFYFRDLAGHIGKKNADVLSVITVPEQTYLIVRSEKSVYYLRDHMDLHRRVVTEWFPNSGYAIANAPEIVFTHSDIKKHGDSYVELWLPIEKVE